MPRSSRHRETYLTSLALAAPALASSSPPLSPRRVRTISAASTPARRKTGSPLMVAMFVALASAYSRWRLASGLAAMSGRSRSSVE